MAKDFNNYNLYVNWTLDELKQEFDRKYINKSRSADIRDDSCFSEYFCPNEEECRRRIEGSYDHEYERTILVKKYERSVAGKEMEEYEDTRSINTLVECTKYLMTIKLTQKSYKFLDNRIRAIKLDLEQLKSVIFSAEYFEKREWILKRIVRFYVVSLYELYSKENDLYQIMEQLRKTIAHLYAMDCKQGGGMTNGQNEDERDEFLAYAILAHLDSPDVAKYLRMTHFSDRIDDHANSGTPVYLNIALNLHRAYIQRRYAYFFSIPLDFMLYSISLYYIDKIRISSMNLFKRGLNEKVDIDVLNEMVGIDMKSTINAFYYNTTDYMVDLKVKNGRNKEIEKISRKRFKLHEDSRYDTRKNNRYNDKNNNSNNFIVEGNIDHLRYKTVVYRYLNWIVDKKKRHVDIMNRIVKRYLIQIANGVLFNNVARNYLNNKIEQELLHIRVEREQQRKKEEEIAYFKFDVLKKVYGDYLKERMYKMIVRKWFEREYWEDIYSVCVVNECDFAGVYTVDESFCKVDSILLHQFNVNMIPRYNLFVFVLKDGGYLSVIDNQLWFINSIVIYDGLVRCNKKERNIAEYYKDIDRFKEGDFDSSNVSNIDPLLKEHNLLRLRKKRRINLLSLSPEEQIEYLIQNRKNMNIDADAFIKRIMEGESVVDLKIYY